MATHRHLRTRLYVTEADYRRAPRSTVALPSVEGAMGYDFGALNEYEGSLNQLKALVRELARTAQRSTEWCAVSVLALLIGDCEATAYRYIVLSNL